MPRPDEPVKILGLKRRVNAEVRVLNAFSAHADRDELMWWATGCGPQVRKFFLVHGEFDQAKAFGERLGEKGLSSEIPAPGDTADLDY